MNAQPNSNAQAQTATTGGVTFWFLFSLLLAGIGGWLTYTYGFTNYQPQFRVIGVSLGVLNLLASVVPLWFGVAVWRRVLGR